DLLQRHLALDLHAQLIRRAPSARDPAADLRGHARQPLGTEDQQRDHEKQQELGETDVEHSFSFYRSTVEVLSFCSANSASGSLLSRRLCASSCWSLSSSWSMALRKLFRAPPRSPPSVFRRLVPNTSTTISRTIRSCQILIPPNPMSILHGNSKFPMIRQTCFA